LHKIKIKTENSRKFKEKSFIIFIEKMKEKVFEEKFHTKLRKSHTQKFEQNIFKKLKRNF
jgi:hypothetical protein